MDFINDESATPSEEPTNGEPGSEPNDGSAGDSGTENSGGTALNAQAFKGLQRRVSAKDREIDTLKSQIANLQSQTSPGGTLDETTLNLIRPLVQRVAKDDPEYARSWAMQLQAQMTADQNQKLQKQLDQRTTAEQREQEESSTLADLRDLANDLGVDPASPLLDYGEADMPLRERMALVRQTASEAKKVVKPSAPKPTVSNGEAHNANPGVPPAPKPPTRTYVADDYTKALAEYRKQPNAANMAKAREIKDALVKGVESTLPKTM